VKELKEKQQDWLWLKARIIFVGKMKTSKKFSEQVRKQLQNRSLK